LLARIDLEGFAFDRAPGPHPREQVQNLVLALREDGRFPALRARLATVHDGASVLATVHAVMPPLAATHRELLFRADALATVSALTRR
jgi:hypothetical protein